MRENTRLCWVRTHSVKAATALATSPLSEYQGLHLFFSINPPLYLVIFFPFYQRVFFKINLSINSSINPFFYYFILTRLTACLFVNDSRSIFVAFIIFIESFYCYNFSWIFFYIFQYLFIYQSIYFITYSSINLHNISKYLHIS